jgi:hypothetical protein
MKFIVEYIRMVAYATIVLSSLKGIAVRKFSSALFVGDIIMALVLLISGLLAKFAEIPREATRDCVLTPAAVIWAIIHFINILKPVDNKKYNK